MSVLIKDMEMPKNCMSCPFPSVGVDWYYCYCPGVDGKAYDFEQSNTVPDDCPLVALPDKHGRLVDADALIEKYWDGNSMEITAWDLKDIKAVIEAEGET